MARRTTLEVDPLILKAINYVARKRKLRVKSVVDGLLRFAIPHEERVFAETNGKKGTQAKKRT